MFLKVSGVLAAAAACALAGSALADITLSGNSLSGNASASTNAQVTSTVAFAKSFPTNPPNEQRGVAGDNQASVGAVIDLGGGGTGGGTSGGLEDTNGAVLVSANINVDVTLGSTLLGPGGSEFLFRIDTTERADPLPTQFPDTSYQTNVNGAIEFVLDVGGSPAPFSLTKSANWMGSALPEVVGDGASIVDNGDGTGTLTSGRYRVFVSGNGTDLFASGEEGPFTPRLREFRLVVRGPDTGCCHPWDNGRPDGRGGQASQIGADDDWRPLVGVSFDDFWLCEGQVHYVNRVSGVINTSSLVPKFIVAILPDCNGLPDITKPLAVAGLAGTRFDVDQEDVPFILGRVEISDNGVPDADGLRPVGVTAHFDLKRLVLKGGSYWVTIFGVSANLNPLDEFFWATSGNNVVKGRPGVFYDGDTFRTSDELCCGCTDYNFCIVGESCKILLDNGGPIVLSSPNQFPAIPSLQNGSNTQTRSRAADKVVVPPCTNFRPCYIEGWMWTNCDRIALQFFRDDCRCPDDRDNGTELIYADCVMETEITATDPTGVPVTLKKARWFFDGDIMAAIGRPPLPGRGGFNVWISLVGQGDNRQNARAYFAFGERCDRECDDGFGCFRAAPFSTTLWRSNDFPGTSIRGNDHALLVAVHEEAVQPPVGTIPTCPADVNNSGDLTVQDLFDFLAAFFAGCP